MNKKAICFYHSADLDGKCSGFLVKQALGEGVELYGIDYGDEFPWDAVEGREVIMVDFSLQPFDQMIKLAMVASRLTWIDHHKTAIDAYEEARAEAKLIHGAFSVADWPGRRDADLAACELTYIHYFLPGFSKTGGDFGRDGAIGIPTFVRLLGRYDVWDHRNEHVVPFQAGMRLRGTLPDADVWPDLFLGSNQLKEIVNEGRAAMKQIEAENKAHAQRAYDGELAGLPAIVLNRGLVNSKAFDTVYDPEKHSLMVAYSRLPINKWKVSLYSDKVDVDCGQIAKGFGGGGHKGAAGFECEELPAGILGVK